MPWGISRSSGYSSSQFGRLRRSSAPPARRAPIRALARTSYEHWLTAHRLAGLFVAVAVVHGAIVDPVLHRSTLLRVLFLVVGWVGVAAYLYRELSPATSFGSTTTR